MRHIHLSSILLLILVIPFIMSYRIGPSDTPYLLFSIIFLGLLIFITLDVLVISKKIYYHLKNIVLWFLIISVIGSSFISAIIVRHQTAPAYMIHDITLQLEAAIRFFIEGQNPYSTTYFGTPLEQWHYSTTEVNPALYHFVMQPFYLLFSLPFYFLSNTVFGFFDGRIPLLFLFFILLINASILIKKSEEKFLFLILLAFNPAMLGYTLEGRSDIFMFTFLFYGFYLLYNKKYSLAGIPIALAFAVKQSAWPLLPFYVLYLFFKQKHIKTTCISLLPFLFVFSIITVPFFIWDSRAFVESTILYLSGATSHSYPISGYGLGSLLYQLSFIQNPHQYYPFYIWQLIIGIPLFIVLIKFLYTSTTVKRLILIYALFLFIYWYLSRYFNNSHLGYLSLLFLSSYFWPDEK